MKIRITQEPSDGKFIVGIVYQVFDVSNEQLVWAYDEKGEVEPVYSYEFEWV